MFLKDLFLKVSIFTVTDQMIFYKYIDDLSLPIFTELEIIEGF